MSLWTYGCCCQGNLRVSTLIRAKIAVTQLNLCQHQWLAQLQLLFVWPGTVITHCHLLVD